MDNDYDFLNMCLQNTKLLEEKYIELEGKIQQLEENLNEQVEENRWLTELLSEYQYLCKFIMANQEHQKYMAGYLEKISNRE